MRIGKYANIEMLWTCKGKLTDFGSSSKQTLVLSKLCVHVITCHVLEASEKLSDYSFGGTRVFFVVMVWILFAPFHWSVCFFVKKPMRRKSPSASFWSNHLILIGLALGSAWLSFFFLSVLKHVNDGVLFYCFYLCNQISNNFHLKMLNAINIILLILYTLFSVT